MSKKGFFSWFKRKDNVEQQENKEELQSEQQEVKELLEETVNKEAVLPSQETSLNDIKEDEHTSSASKDNNEVVASEELATKEESTVTEVNKDQVLESEKLKTDDVELTSQEEKIPEPQSKPHLFKRLWAGLKNTRDNVGLGIVALFKGRQIDDELFEDLETALLTADVGYETTNKLLDKLTKEAKLKELKDANALTEKLTSELKEILNEVSAPLVIDTTKKPFVILMVGVNGVGKTTTIGKLAKVFSNKGLKVMLAAGDTFRAAAVDQLKVWGQRNNIPVVAQDTGADSASVIYDALNSAKAKGYDVLIADTAGRLQNKANLMEELRKIVRVMKKIDETAPHEVMLTLDAGTGQNAISQAKLFSEVTPITGINLTKLDGTAKGGVIFNIANLFKIPIRYIGIGEGVDDLREFNSEDFIKALFAEENMDK